MSIARIRRILYPLAHRLAALQPAGGAPTQARVHQRKRGFLVLGPEGSGSAFIAQVVSFVVGHCRTFGEWNGYGFNDRIGADNLVLHRSIPYFRPKIFPKRVADLAASFAGYDETKTILTARDRSRSMMSKIRHFGGTWAEANEDVASAQELFAELLDNDEVFLWSYETMMLYGQPYFRRLYRFLNVDSAFEPPVRDANAQYLQQVQEAPESGPSTAGGSSGSARRPVMPGSNLTMLEFDYIVSLTRKS